MSLLNVFAPMALSRGVTPELITAFHEGGLDDTPDTIEVFGEKDEIIASTINSVIDLIKMSDPVTIRKHGEKRVLCRAGDATIVAHTIIDSTGRTSIKSVMMVYDPETVAYNESLQSRISDAIDYDRIMWPAQEQALADIAADEEADGEVDEASTPDTEDGEDA